MEEIRPLLAMVGLLVVAAGLLIWLARMRGWRFEWWERFFSPGSRRVPRTAVGEAGAARSPRGARADGSRPSSRAPFRESEPAGKGRPASGRAASGSERQTLIDLDFLPLLDPEDAVGGVTTPLDREFDVGDLGAIETGAGGERSRPAPARDTPAPSTASETAGTGPGQGPRSDRRAASKPRRPAAGKDRTPAEPDEAGSRPPTGGRELLIVLTIITPGERDLAGPVIRDALGAFDMSPDDHGMFHHYGNRRGPPHAPVFSVANVLEPGVFDLARMDELATPGLYLFMRRPGPLPATVAFDLMLDVGTRLSRTLKAALCDDQRCRLTVQATQALRERVVHFALRHERGAPDAG